MIGIKVLLLRVQSQVAGEWIAEQILAAELIDFATRIACCIILLFREVKGNRFLRETSLANLLKILYGSYAKNNEMISYCVNVEIIYNLHN